MGKRKRSGPKPKHQKKLFRRLADYAKTVQGKDGYHKPGSNK